MLRRPRVVLLCGFLFGLAAPAGATTLYTPPLSGHFAGTCTLVNVGKKPIDVTIDVLGGLGNVINTAEATADPGGIAYPAPSAPFVSTIGYCRFTFKGSRKSVRADYFVIGPGPDFRLEAVVKAD